MIKGLLETGFLLALNPNDRNHQWALSILARARRGELKIHISPAAVLELSLLLRSRGMDDKVVARVLKAMDRAISLYTRPQYCSLSLQHLSYAAELREKYSDLTFFDSIHAATAIIDKLVYMDLDPVIQSVVEAEKRR